ncbi:MAG: PEP/pyruvate-binding domain-containing protein [Chloroflexota bacterium]
MPTEPLRSITPPIDIYIKLAQYPILCDRIRLRMREELFRRGIVNMPDFEAEVKQKAIESQQREGLTDPFSQEEANQWQRRKDRIRDYQTDAYFGFNLGASLLDHLIEEVLADQPGNKPDTIQLTFNPEISPWEMLFKQGKIYEALPPPEREKVAHHLEEIKVVLIKGMISDQLPFIGVAKKVFDMADLHIIYKKRIGGGKIGGKAAGMALAWKILQQKSPKLGPELSQQVSIPDSFYVGTEAFYDFRQINQLDHMMNEKYRPIDEVKNSHPLVVKAHLAGRFPDAVVTGLRNILDQVGDSPLIVRSSSLLEDNFGYAFAGKYESHFCPNQGTPEQNLEELLNAVRRVYASVGNPNALLYRQQNGLIDYDERMAILVQKLRGQRYGRYFFPVLAGVAYSSNPFRWNPKIRREDGFLRLVWGLGTRAVDRVAHDYPRLIALSHPRLRPETNAAAIRQYSQTMIDVIDLEENKFKTLPIEEILTPDYPFLRLLASVDRGEFLQDIVSNASSNEEPHFVLTFDGLTKDAKFVKLMRTALRRLEDMYKTPVDVEFTVEIIPKYPYPDYKLHLLQCRPLRQRSNEGSVSIPTDIAEGNKLFSSHHLVPDGKAEGVRYVIFVDPERYSTIEDYTIKKELGRVVGRLNKRLEGEQFIMMGPGRWGSANIDLGVHVTYADLFHTKILIEIAVPHEGRVPELSYGTHFFQDLVEAGIYSLALNLADPDSCLNWAFFRESPNCLAQLSPEDAGLSDYLRVIDIATTCNNKRLNVYMNGSRDEAVGYLAEGDWPIPESQGTLSLF